MRIFTLKHRKKLSVALKGRKLSEEHKKKISQNNSRYFLGKIMSEETKAKISVERWLGKPDACVCPMNEMTTYEHCGRSN